MSGSDGVRGNSGDDGSNDLRPACWNCLDNSGLAYFQPCALHIRARSEVDLGVAAEDLVVRALSTHAHEYVHYLHSIGTAAGQAYLLGNLALLGQIGHGTDSNGHFLGEDRLPDTQRQSVKTILRSLQIIRGKIPPPVKGPGLVDWKFWGYKISTPETLHGLGLSRVTTEIKARRKGGELITGTVEIGYSFVTEGVAYEVDREIRRMQRKESHLERDFGVPAYPYLAYGELVDAWVGRKTNATERVLIGNAALGSPSVGSNLKAACKAVARSKKGARVALSEIFETGRLLSRQLTEDIHHMVRTIAVGETVKSGLEDYLSLIDRSNEIRKVDPAPELLLIERPLDVEGFYALMGQLIDAMVFQHKPGGGLEMSWIGPGLVARSDEQASRMATVQSAFHFNQLHHRASSDLIDTASLPSSPCPYFGACGVSLSPEQQEICQATPWKMFIDDTPGDKACWYAAGVKAVRRAGLADQ